MLRCYKHVTGVWIDMSVLLPGLSFSSCRAKIHLVPLDSGNVDSSCEPSYCSALLSPERPKRRPLEVCSKCLGVRYECMQQDCCGLKKSRSDLQKLFACCSCSSGYTSAKYAILPYLWLFTPTVGPLFADLPDFHVGKILKWRWKLITWWQRKWGWQKSSSKATSLAALTTFHLSCILCIRYHISALLIAWKGSTTLGFLHIDHWGSKRCQT